MQKSNSDFHFGKYGVSICIPFVPLGGASVVWLKGLVAFGFLWPLCLLSNRFIKVWANKSAHTYIYIFGYGKTLSTHIFIRKNKWQTKHWILHTHSWRALFFLKIERLTFVVRATISGVYLLVKDAFALQLVLAYSPHNKSLFICDYYLIATFRNLFQVSISCRSSVMYWWLQLQRAVRLNWFMLSIIQSSYQVCKISL